MNFLKQANKQRLIGKLKVTDKQARDHLTEQKSKATQHSMCASVGKTKYNITVLKTQALLHKQQNKLWFFTRTF